MTVPEGWSDKPDRCETCRFYYENGSCRKNAPIAMLPVFMEQGLQLPTVERTFWCGDFEYFHNGYKKEHSDSLYKRIERIYP